MEVGTIKTQLKTWFIRFVLLLGIALLVIGFGATRLLNPDFKNADLSADETMPTESLNKIEVLSGESHLPKPQSQLSKPRADLQQHTQIVSLNPVSRILDKTATASENNQIFEKKPHDRFHFVHEVPSGRRPPAQPLKFHPLLMHYSHLTQAERKQALDEGDVLARMPWVHEETEKFRTMVRDSTANAEQVEEVFRELEHVCIAGVRDNYHHYAFKLSYLYLIPGPYQDKAIAYAWHLVFQWMLNRPAEDWSTLVPTMDSQFTDEAEGFAITFINSYLRDVEPGTSTLSEVVY